METSGIETEFYPSGKNVLLILTGIGGSVKGHQNKYQTIAETAVKNHGFSVCVVTMPQGSWECPEDIFRYAMSVVQAQVPDCGDVYAMGNSAGATFLLWYAYLFPQIKKVLAINPVLNVNLHRANHGIRNFTGGKIFLAVGEKDASNLFSEFLEGNQETSVIRLENTDHYFTDNLGTFLSLPERLLFV